MEFSFSSSQNIEIQGHRGARSIYPENTIMGFQYALNLGVDVLEMDLGVTKDNILVVNHDPYINKDICLGPKGERLRKSPLIRTLTLKEVQSYDCGSLKNPRFPKQKTVPGEKIPSLEDVFIWLQTSSNLHAQKVRLNIETKINPKKPKETPSPKEFVRLLIKLLKKYNLVERSTIQSFDFRTLDEAFLQLPELRRVALIESSSQDMLKIAQKHRVQIISPYYKLLKTKASVQALQNEGFNVIPWTVNDKKGWKRMKDFSVDGIITDDPEALMEFLNTSEN